MKQALLTTLRDINTSRHQFRQATEKLSFLLAGQAGECIQEKEVLVRTPVATATGTFLTDKLVLVPILRAGLAMLPAFLSFYPDSSVGFFGIRRDEVTKKANLYYENIPPLTKDHTVIIIDPMIATGGSAVLAVNKMLQLGVEENHIICVGIVAAPEGISAVKTRAPKAHLLTAQIDEKLNQDAFIVPGLGDFGDRYFGTKEQQVALEPVQNLCDRTHISNL